jgi:diguanylate cyclase (GGDEF)-like protein
MPAWFDAQVPLGPVALIAGAAALLIVGVYQWRLRRLRQLQADLMRQVRERTDQVEDANRKLALMSYIDAVTEVANRRSFEEELKMEWRRSTRSKSPVSLLMADIDGFKAYNDALGHQAGDHSLKKVASVIGECVGRAGDLVARYGGEEFVVLLPDTDADGASVLAERIRAAVEERNVWHPGSALGRLTISIGAATMTGREDGDASGLVKAADEALYRAKADGRNVVRVASSATQ